MNIPLLDRVALALLGFLLSLCFGAPTPAQQAASTYAITHAKIFTLAGSAIDDGTLVIKDGKIAGVGANVEVPAGAQVIDGKGLRFIPAFSMRSHRWV